MDSLFSEGYTVLSSKNTKEDLQATVLPLLPPGYSFLDYKYTIKGSALITYHRDVTSARSSFHTKYPTYTAIHYDYEGEFLSVSPRSHRHWQFRLPTTLQGPKDTLVLFDCDLVHGGLNAPPGIQRIATQYKIAHKDDIPLLYELQGIDVVKEATSIGRIWSWFFRIGSYVFVVPIELFCRHLLQRQYAKGIGAWFQRRLPFGYFNNPGGYSKVK